MIVIGDVHGCLKTLIELKKQLPHDNLCFTGDLIDRGSESVKTVQHIIDNDYKCVLGNHEEMMYKASELVQLHYSEKRDAYEMWQYNGGGETFSDYKDNSTQEVYLSHLEWMNKLPLYIEYQNKNNKKFVISHSSVRAVWGLRTSHDSRDKYAFRRDCLWVRGLGACSSEFEEKVDFNVIGHTPMKTVVTKDNTVFLDTGCVYGESLSAYDLETGVIYSQKFVE